MCELLNNAEDLASEHYNASEIIGVRKVLTHRAMSAFIQGIYNKLIRSNVLSTNPKSLDDAIIAAARMHEKMFGAHQNKNFEQWLDCA